MIVWAKLNISWICINAHWTCGSGIKHLSYRCSVLWPPLVYCDTEAELENYWSFEPPRCWPMFHLAASTDRNCIGFISLTKDKVLENKTRTADIVTKEKVYLARPQCSVEYNVVIDHSRFFPLTAPGGFSELLPPHGRNKDSECYNSDPALCSCGGCSHRNSLPYTRVIRFNTYKAPHLQTINKRQMLIAIWCDTKRSPG